MHINVATKEDQVIVQKQSKPNNALPALFVAGVVITAEAATIGGFIGDFSHLKSDSVIMTMLCSILILLSGVFIRMRQMRAIMDEKSLALEKSNERIRLMGDNLPKAIIFQLSHVPNEEFRFNYLSREYERMLGFNRDATMANALLAYDQVHEEDIQLLKDHFRSGVENMKPANLELRVLDKNSAMKWLQVSAVPHRVDNAIVWDGFVLDVSEMKSAENALLEEKRNFQNLFETIDDFLIVCDMEGGLLHTNPSVKNRLEYDVDELTDMSIFDLYPAESKKEVVRLISRLQSEESSMCGMPLKTKSGQKILVEMSLFQGSWKNQSAIFGVARDVGSRQRTENALRESQRMLQLIMDTIPMSVFWKDKDSIYLGCNKTFITECGLDSVEGVIGKTPYDLFDPNVANEIVQRDQRVLASNAPVLGKLESKIRSDGTMGWREFSKIPLRNEQGEAVGVLGVWRDVTEKKQAEERLKRTLEDMERFNHLMRGRERRTLELKEEVNELLKKLDLAPKYRTTTENLK